MDKQKEIELIDKKMQDDGWIFFGPLLHYKKAWKEQAAIYVKNGKYIVSGIESKGEFELNESITEVEAIKRKKESLEEIKKHIFSSIK